MNKTDLVNEVMKLADQMAQGAATMSGMGYDQLINGRQQLQKMLETEI